MARGYRRRWRLVHAIGPVLVAAFANSPLRVGRPTGWRSSRQQVWSHMDPGRTRPPTLGPDPREAWARYALDAQVMCVREEGSADWSAPPGLTFRDWVRGGTADRTLRRPTVGDLDYHLSTLFPPVRPHGHLELRMIDAQPGDGWIVPLAVASALLDDARASDAAMAAAERLWAGHGPGESPRPAGRLPVAARGPARAGRPGHRRASRECFEAARAALVRMAAPRRSAAVDAFTERYVSRDRARPTTYWRPVTENDALRERIAAELMAARDRTTLLTTAIDEADLVKQHSPLMSPLVWDLAHIANQEELWLLREVGGRDPLHPEIDPLYDAFEHPRAERPTLPLLGPGEARGYGHEVRGRVLDLLERAAFRQAARLRRVAHRQRLRLRPGRAA